MVVLYINMETSARTRAATVNMAVTQTLEFVILHIVTRAGTEYIVINLVPKLPLEKIVYRRVTVSRQDVITGTESVNYRVV